MNGNRLSEVIESEIQWCLSNPSSELSVEFQKGFISGLRQAKFFIDNAVEQSFEADLLSPLGQSADVAKSQAA